MPYGQPAAYQNSGLNGTPAPWTKVPGLTKVPGMPKVPLDSGAPDGSGGGGLAALLAPSGNWTSKTVSTHPYQGLQGLLESSILGRLMTQRGQEGTEVRGLDGGGVAWNHLEDPYGRLMTTTDTYRPGVAPPRKKFGGMADQLENVFTKVIDENGYPVEAFPGPWKKNGLMSNGQPMQYTHGQTGAPIPNPYI